MRILAWPAFKNRKHNPYNYLLYSALQKLGCHVEDLDRWRCWWKTYDILHIHWPEQPLNRWSIVSYLKIEALFSLIRLHKARGAKVVWTVHNLEPHEKPSDSVLKWYYREFLRHVDAAIYLSEMSLHLARSKYPILSKIPSSVIPHGHYWGVYPDHVDKNQARNYLGLSASDIVLVFLGQIRPYKGVEALIDSFRFLPGSRVRLLIAGKPLNDSYLKHLLSLAHGDDRIRFFPRFVPDEELQYYLRAADLMILPYTEILNSGSALLGLSFDLPVLVPSMGSMRELQSLLGNQWVRLFDPPLSVEAIQNALEQGKPAGRPALERLDWDVIARRTKGFYEMIRDTTA